MHCLLKNEALSHDKCMSCHTRRSIWRCLDCIRGNSYCTHCFRDRHVLLPFHRVEHWTGTHFTPAWLFQVGVEIHLGHNGLPCPNRQNQDAGIDPPVGSVPLEPHVGDACASSDGEDDGEDGDCDWEDDMEEEVDDTDYGLPALVGEDVCVIVDKSRVHQLRVHPCHCSGHAPLDMQFLDMGLFPGTLRRIKTAFTFVVLDNLHMENLECKTAGLKYYSKLRRMTSNTFPQSVPVSADFNV